MAAARAIDSAIRQQMEQTLIDRLLICGMVGGILLWRFELAEFYTAGIFGAACLVILDCRAFRSNITLWDAISRCLVTVGLLLNLIVIAANDGYMPVIRQRATFHNVWKPVDAGTHFLFLCDRFALVIPMLGRRSLRLILSVGDLFMAAGFIASIAYARIIAFRMRPRKRTAAERATAQARFERLPPETQERLRSLLRPKM